MCLDGGAGEAESVWKGRGERSVCVGRLLEKFPCEWSVVVMLVEFPLFVYRCCSFYLLVGVYNIGEVEDLLCGNENWFSLCFKV